jgi:DNA replication protein DnaC
LASFEVMNPSLKQALWATRRFVDDYPFEKIGMLLVGSIGVGKTHLAVGAIHELIRSKGIPCYFCDYRELLKEIQNSYNPAVQATELEILRPVLETEVLVLDELGAIRSSEWVWDTVSYIINYRYNEKKTTIITTNFHDLPSRKAQEEEPRRREYKSRDKKDAEDAVRAETLGDRITDRMRSRLHEMCRVISIEGSDFRTLGTSRHP